jgi:hypothetical protein
MWARVKFANLARLAGLPDQTPSAILTETEATGRVRALLDLLAETTDGPVWMLINASTNLANPLHC